MRFEISTVLMLRTLVLDLSTFEGEVTTLLSNVKIC